MGKQNKIILSIVVIVIITGLIGFFGFKKLNKTSLVSNSISIAKSVINLLPIKENSKKEMQTIDALSKEFIKQDNKERRYLILLQNNMELRPGGGFLGQYAVMKIKNGEIIKLYFEDANLLDQRIKEKIPAPYPFKRMTSIKKWKFRDSNFSPDFPTNAEKAKYFYRLSGRNSDFNGVIAVNADTFNHIFDLTGPLIVPGYGIKLDSKNATLKLEEIVEKKYILDDSIDTQNRKSVMKNLMHLIAGKLGGVGNVPKISKFVLNELRNKDIMLNFEDTKLQKMVESVHWGGKVSEDWAGDYLMLSDANMGALKTNYYVTREINYNVDLTGERPIANLEVIYKNSATYGDWRTSDYHSYFRVYVPKGSKLLERKMVSYPLVQEDFGKTYFGFLLHVLINRQTDIKLKYELPESIKNKDYKLLIQKQSGMGDVPIKINVKTNDGELSQEAILKKDLKFEVRKQ